MLSLLKHVPPSLVGLNLSSEWVELTSPHQMEHFSIYEAYCI